MAVLGLDFVRRSLHDLSFLHSPGDICLSSQKILQRCLKLTLFRPIIMVKKAAARRRETGDENYYAPLEREEKKSISRRIEDILLKPFKVLFQEPMLQAITVYMSVSRHPPRLYSQEL